MPDPVVPMSQMTPSQRVAAMNRTPSRSTNERSLDQWNIAMRASPAYQNFMVKNGLPTDGHVRLSRSQQEALERELARAGTPVPSGMHIDQGGNLNQKNRLVRNAAIIAGATAGAYFGGPALMSALGPGATTAAPTVGAGVMTGAPAAATVGTGLGVGATEAGLLTSTMTPLATSMVPYATPIASSALAPSVWGAAAQTAGGGGGSNFLSGLTGRDKASLVTGALNSGMQYLGQRSANNAAKDAAQMQAEQFAAQQKFLAEEAEKGRIERAEVEAEKKRQWEAEQAELLRKWHALEPWRTSSQRNLVGMNEMLDRPKPQPTAYQPTFTSRSYRG